MTERDTLVKLVRAHLYLTLFYVALTVGLLVMHYWKDWDTEFLAGFAFCMAWREADVWSACKRWWPKHTKKIYEEYNTTAEMIKLTRRGGSTPIYDEMGGRPR